MSLSVGLLSISCAILVSGFMNDIHAMRTAMVDHTRSHSLDTTHIYYLCSLEH
jgi:hypothetical protein